MYLDNKVYSLVLSIVSQLIIYKANHHRALQYKCSTLVWQLRKLVLVMAGFANNDNLEYLFRLVCWNLWQ